MTTKQLSDIPFSVLDLSPIIEGGTPTESLQNTLDLAKHSENWGYHRYWVAEHHNMPSIASSATSIVIAHIAQGTSEIRVGSGGIMLPNHAPLVIAEQFGTLESLYPGRIDLGLGRAPGTDRLTAHALRRSMSSGEDFPEQLEELRFYFNQTPRTSGVHAIPGEGLTIPIWLLGSSGYSAQLAGQLGLPFSFASHFSPANTLPALNLYRQYFTPSAILDKPCAMVCVNVIAADTDQEAEILATTLQQHFINLMRNDLKPLQPPVDSMDSIWTPYEKTTLQDKLGSTIIGSPKTVQDKLQAFLDLTDADELMINTMMYDHKARLHSYEIVSQLLKNK
ncbi:MsnO8 family LLM class oxidoreductase [Terrilactibacillus sp. BCM23-1]|uniref:MsnO8 family LLM class oxidoreductase n=1 Tax=Terrilactibacillus tamarindi TaxID=2599694 RepID=A0A6N8CT56_9BACI|nr:LLM class flavin-dependent oxidoreductase [Terrilactibacillus tamarindi]MTT33334.1 MsnO8 family LLM class oxidoreductase [Terrilactibacillus tamarindi]